MPIDKNTFCVAPWYSLYLDSKKRMAPCCKFQEPQDAKTLEEYFTSQELQQVRQDLLNGVKNPNCIKCWTDEANGGDSLRLISNRTISHAEDLNIAKQIENPRADALLSFDLTLGNLCNLKCVMCTPALSSQILSESNTNLNLKSLYSASTDFNQRSYDWPKQEQFVTWCKQHLPNAIHIKFTGGEPFIIPWINQVIEHIPDVQKSKCILHFTSNLTVVNHKLFEQFSKFKEVWISVSVEGVEETFEYMRFGHKWNTLVENISAIMQMKIPNLILKVNHVVQAPSFQSIQKMVDYFDKLEIDIAPILLSAPKHFTLGSLTTKCKQDFIDDTAEYKGHNKNFMQVVRSFTAKNLGHDPDQTTRMVEHLSRLDSVRGNDYTNVIPTSNINY